MQRLLRYLGRLARPFLRPDWDDERRTLGQMQSRLERLSSLRDVVSEHASELSRLRQRLDQIARSDVAHLRTGAAELRRAVLGHVHVAHRAFRRTEFLDQQSARELVLARVIDRARRTGRPVLVGPWTGEIGFELLYWIPFLRRLKARLPDNRFVAMSRGGVSAWYAGIADGYRDIFESTDPEEFRTRTDLETRKQRTVGPFDRRLLRDARAALGLERPVVVHPSLMYELLYAYWKDQLPVRRLAEYLEPARLADAPDAALPVDLPDEYVAARFYFSRCFPDTPSNRGLVADVLRRAGARAPVVLLNMPFAVDDHVDAPDMPGVRTVGQFLTPANNLATQTAIIRRARAFVGTYGGFSYLAPLCGVPSITFYTETTFFEQHLEFARRTFSQVGAAPFLVLHERERALLDALLPPAPPT